MAGLQAQGGIAGGLGARQEILGDRPCLPHLAAAPREVPEAPERRKEAHRVRGPLAQRAYPRIDALHLGRSRATDRRELAPQGGLQRQLALDARRRLRQPTEPLDRAAEVPDRLPRGLPGDRGGPGLLEIPDRPVHVAAAVEVHRQLRGEVG
jgi:hypothetical protein